MNESELTIASASPDSRNELALVRTELANERTLMAYLRTAVMFAATAVSLIKFFPDTPNVMAATVLLGAIATLLGVTGVYRFLSLKHRLKATN